jgi:N6-L-threonylcarbamoyladenine synthase/protein kinase Bud32
MLAEMCEQRGADFHVPEDRFLRDNAGMIAVLGAKMAAAGDTVAIADSAVDSDFRPDEVAVTWRDPDVEGGGSLPVTGTGDPDGETHQGAEATVEIRGDTVVKRRIPRTYRHPTLDERLRRERTRQEARLTSAARREGVPTPVVRDVDVQEATIEFGYVGDRDLRDALTEGRVRDVSRHLARIHDAGVVHGDPTTRNVRVDGDRTYLIDFGLGYASRGEEDHAVDLHVFANSLAGTADDAERLRRAAEDAYRETSDRGERVLDRLRSVEGRGRYR